MEEKVMGFLVAFYGGLGEKEGRWVFKWEDIHKEAANI